VAFWLRADARSGFIDLQAIFKLIAADVALCAELLAILLLALGSLEATWRVLRRPSEWRDLDRMKAIWLLFATRIALALELALAADIVRTAIAPSWTDIGQLAAIAAIRTALNLFLERDIEAFGRRDEATGAKAARKAV
jgi:uncharacterized membrane protein